MGAPTPVSDAMEHIAESASALSHFLDAFATSKVMVVATSKVSVPPGDYVTRGDEISVGSTDFPDQVIRLLCCADPPAFIQRFGRKNFNAEMPGSELFKTLLHNKDVPGILVNSARSETSIIITREQAAWWLDRAQKAKDAPRPWWKIW